jgi:hypothetical protein
MVASAEVVAPAPGPTPACSAEETECVLRWLERPGTRLIAIDGTWASPVHGAGRVRYWSDAADDARDVFSAAGLVTAGRRDPGTVHQPAGAVSRIAG